MFPFPIMLKSSGRGLLVCLAGLAILTGCGAPSDSIRPGGTSATPVKARPGALKSMATAAPKKATPETPNKAPEVKPERENKEKSLIALAEEIILAAKNPFLSKLPKIETASESESPGDPGSPVESAPVVEENPLDDISVSGVVYNGKKSMALLSSADGGHMVTRGDVVSFGSEQLKILSIDKSSVEIQQLAKPENRKTLQLPDIVGYTAGASTSKSSEAGEAPSVNTPDAGAAPSSDVPPSKPSKGSKTSRRAKQPEAEKFGPSGKPGAPGDKQAPIVTLQEP